MEKLLKWLDAPIQLFIWIALVVGVLMMVHVTADVVARAMYNPLIGTNEIVSGYYMIIMVFLPWAYIARGDNHIVADIFTRSIPHRVMFWIEIGIKMLTVVYLSVFTWETIIRAIQQTRAVESVQVAGGYAPIWPSRWALPLAGLLMGIYLIVRIIADVIRGPDNPRPKPDMPHREEGAQL